LLVASTHTGRFKTNCTYVLWTPQSRTQVNILADVFLKMDEYIMVHVQFNKQGNIENMVLLPPPAYTKRNNYWKILTTLAYYARFLL